MKTQILSLLSLLLFLLTSSTLATPKDSHSTTPPTTYDLVPSQPQNANPHQILPIIDIPPPHNPNPNDKAKEKWIYNPYSGKPNNPWNPHGSNDAARTGGHVNSWVGIWCGVIAAVLAVGGVDVLYGALGGVLAFGANWRGWEWWGLRGRLWV
jgi:hypothetical protein